ncbi:thiamine pyrophosphate-dependent dehydrogenase E1 component subunit alpha [Daejeonella sp.]|uniref:thiamine pyrophosphate-dependent dehydrogenase E1 component subunit alpha n=1 Tax=Daejeonella sp. TaxID=2805397 RepID=UPI0030BA3DBF
MSDITADMRVSQYKELLRIRRTEEILAEEYRKGTMRTPTHFGIGQEAVAVGVCGGLNLGDVVYTHHRSHTHYLAKGGSPFGLIAELLGREGGCSRGRGGSVHLVDRSVGFLGSSPVLGHSLALATGSALAFKMDNKPSIAVAFFGEGAFDEGSAWESLNYAATWKLPVMFVCENNLYATESPLSVRQPEGTSFCERANAFKVKSQRVDGNDVDAVFGSVKSTIDACRSGAGPVLLECMTYRWREHVGPLWDYEANRTFRPKAELESWMEKCPVKRSGGKLISMGISQQSDLDSWRADINDEIENILQNAYDSPWPDPSTLFENI